MILQALVNLYEKLAEKGEISERGYSVAGVSYGLRISEAGELLGIITLKEEVERGKKTVEVPKRMPVPERANRTVGIESNFLCDNAMYLLGFNTKRDPENKKLPDPKYKKRAVECFNAAKELHLKILGDTDNAESRSVKAFFGSWNPSEAEEHELLSEYTEEFMSGANLVLMTADMDFIHTDYDVKKAWDTYKNENASGNKMQCLVTGEYADIALLHNKIKGVKGAQSAGANLVSFNSPSLESYGREGSQGLNAPVSEYAMFAYTTALNHLIADRDHCTVIGDTTLVYWAENAEREPQDAFAMLSNTSFAAGENTDGMLDSVMKKVAAGQPLEFDESQFKTNFYILGISPNEARLSVRLFHADTFSNIVQNLLNHYKRLEIEKAPQDRPYLSPYMLLNETVPKTSTDKTPLSLLAGAVMRAIITDGKYPEALPRAVITRIRAEHEITSGKAAIIKAFLLKKNSDKFKEELGVSLNTESNNRAYVLGRLFAVLERTQEEANNSTNIRAKFFNSACAAPATVFPTLLRLSNHHITKLSDKGKWRSRDIGELIDKLSDGGFPKRLSLDEQGIFIKGYYHQVQDKFVKRNNKTEETSNG